MKKHMRKVTALLLALCMSVSLAACRSENEDSGYELALVTDLGTIDDEAFNQGSWEGLVDYAEEHDITYTYYQPTEQSDDAYLATIDLAVKGGAKVVVTPGYLFEVPVYIAQERYPDVHFVLVDGEPHNAEYEYATADNTVAVLYAEEEAGFLAGYAAVRDGMTKLGFIGGMAVPAVVRFGYGFVQGAEYAAQEMELEPGSVTVNFNYTGDFIPTPETQTKAASWYNDGVEVIFACGGGLGASVMAAADQVGGKVIGVDVDQSGKSESVISSAMKGLTVSVYDCIEDYYNDTFPSGQTLLFNAANDGVGLPLETSKFTQFDKELYDAVFAKLVAGDITLVKDADADGEPLAVADLPAEIVEVVEID